VGRGVSSGRGPPGSWPGMIGNIRYKQHATRDTRSASQVAAARAADGTQAAGSAAPPAGWPQFGHLTGIEGWGVAAGCFGFAFALGLGLLGCLAANNKNS
jgi:hypothetical protein